MRIHGIQLAYDDEETIGQRRDRVAGLLRREVGADLIMLPELWPQTGFGYQNWTETAEPLDGPTVHMVREAARELRTSIHAGSVVERDENGTLWNTSVLVGSDGQVLGSYRKIHRFGFGSGEPVLLEPGEDVVTLDLPTRTPGGTADSATPVEPATIRTGLVTCYDLRFPELFRAHVDAGTELFLIPAAWPAARVGHWTILGQARAIENQAIVVQVNTAGTHARHEMGGNSQIVDVVGRVLAQAGASATVIVADVDPASPARARQNFPVLQDRRLS